MRTKNIVKDYYGASYFIDKNKDKDLIVFIVDDNIPYLNLLKKLLERPNFSIFTFSTGEECLEYLQLEPDLVILDYHLDGVNPYAMKGDRVAELIEQKVPSVEIIMISSDNKFNLISELHLSNTKNVIYKDESAIGKIKIASEKLVEKSTKGKVNYKIPFIIILSAFLLENILIIILK